jgi:predicted membrane-bound spermidine synthase
MSPESSRNSSGRALFAVIVALFFLSGASGLVYQVIWVRLLTRVFGTTTFAVSALLAAFMGGLGLGSYVAARFLVRRRSPLLLFGLLELGVGVYAVSLLEILPLAESLFLSMARGGALSPFAEASLKVVLSFLLLLPPTTLMGASLPLLVKQTAHELGYLGRKSGGLYALNTFGAAFGCFAAGFYAIPSLGLSGTTLLAASINASVGIAAAALHARLGPAESAPPPESEPAPAGPLLLVFVAFAASGFVAIGLEVVWTRLFTLVFKGYTYSFSAMLTVLLLGIALGSLLFAPIADRSGDRRSLFGTLQVAIGVSAVLAAPLFLVAESFVRYATAVLGFDWSAQALAKFLVSLAILIVPTFLFGAQFPVVTRLATANVEGAGGRVGELYAVNVAGGILGALLTGFVLLPVLGTQKSLLLLSLALLASGVALLVGTRRRALAVAAAAAALTVGLSWDVSRKLHESWLTGEETVGFYREGADATVMVAENPPRVNEDKRILVNGSSASNSTHYGLSVNRIQGCIPFFFERMPGKVLATCFGTGITFGTLSQFGVDRIDGVDISPEVIAAAPRFGEQNYGVASQGRVTLHIDDGRNFLLKSTDRYDVITMEPMPPALAGVSDLYTREFYELCRERLAEGGIVSQWVPLYYLGLEDVRILYRTFAESFPHVLVFFYHFDTFLVGSYQPLRISADKFADRLRSERLIADLEQIGLASSERMLGTFLMDRAAVLEFAGGAPVMTDDLPYVEFSGPKSFDLSTTAYNYLAVTEHATSGRPYLAPASDPAFEHVGQAIDLLFEQNRDKWKAAREAQARRDRAREKAKAAGAID